MNEPRWINVTGGIHNDGAVTTFRLDARSVEGARWAQRVEVASIRLEDDPSLYTRTLNAMVRDIEARIS